MKSAIFDGPARNMTQFINIDGQLISAECPVATAANRSLRYGDGLFESMHWKSGRLPLGDFHFQRLFEGMKALRLERPSTFTAEYLRHQIDRLCAQNKLDSARIRLNVFREDGGLLVPLHNSARFIIETAPLTNVSDEPLQLTVYREQKKASGLLANLKTNSHLLYILAAQYANAEGFDDALILNTAYRFCEATSSNVFFIRDGRLYTPSLEEGCVAGVMRRYLLTQSPRMGISVSEIPVDRELLMTMDEMFLTNAVRGIRMVGSFSGKSFSTSIGSKLAKAFNLFS